MTLIAAGLAVELLRLQPETYRAGEALRALHHSAAKAGLSLTPTTAYVGASPWLLLWGPGAPARAEIMRRHVAAGGRAIALDLAYWNRATKVRVSIDAAHPQAWVMRRDWPSTRLDRDRPAIADRWNPEGPVIVAGIGVKAQAQYGSAVDVWEAQMLAAAKTRWPTRQIVHRPKPTAAVLNPDAVVSGASLVITWHSNIAVDAIRMGIPVVCRDGAAAAVCPSELPVDPQPLPVHVRDRFLQNLAYFQWAPNEAVQCWTFLRELLA